MAHSLVGKDSSADSLLGLLQRGRGLGFLQAMEHDPAEVHDLLYVCVTTDPRFDSQVETRADYYARLMLSTGMASLALAPYLRGKEDERLHWGTTLTIETLGYLAQLGDASAGHLLHQYIGYGAQWDFALQQLSLAAPAGALSDVPAVLCARFPTAALFDDSAAFGTEWMIAAGGLLETWAAENPCIENLLQGLRAIEAVAAIRARTRHARLQNLDVQALLAEAAASTFIRIGDLVAAQAKKEDAAALVAALETDSAFRWYVAAKGLQAIGYDIPFDIDILSKAESRLLSLPDTPGRHRIERRAVARLMEMLPPAVTLPWARTWLLSDNSYLQETAEDLLALHAVPDDAGLVTGALARLVEADAENVNTYGACSLLDIMAHFGSIGRIPAVEQIYVQTAYAPARTRAACAMSVNSLEWFAQSYAIECLWDCDSDIRMLGCQYAPLRDSRAKERLQKIAADPLESDSLRNAARQRLGDA